MDREAEAALIVQNLTGFTLAVQQRLLQKLGSFSVILDAEPRSTGDKLDAAWQASLRSFREAPDSVLNLVEDQREILLQHQAEVLPFTDSRYPALLKEISSPPPVLFVRGNAEALSLPQLGIVGSRRPTKSGIATAKDFSRFLAANGFVITSGMALGIDAQAHSGALDAGKTIAVTGSGIDIVYPKQHKTLEAAIVAGNGAVVSEFLPGTQPIAENFPRRNRIISGMSIGVLVVEAAIRSGSLITAREAMHQGREVFAIPGSIHNPMSRGCHHLIREGAKLVETGEDIVQELGGLLAYKGEEINACVPSDFTELEQVVLKAMGFDPVDFDSLIERTRLTIVEVNQQLVSLELKGAVENRDGLFVRC